MRNKLATALLLSATAAFAQSTSVKSAIQPSTTQRLAQSSPDTTAPARVSGAAAVWRLRFQLWLLELSGVTTSLPSLSAFTTGNRVIPAGTTLTGPIGVTDGSVDVFGTIQGPIVVIDGNVRIHPGAAVNGDALAVRGRVVNQGGAISGEARALSTMPANQAATEPGPPHDTMWALKLTLGWFAVLALIGVGVMIFAETNLDGVVLTLERGIGRSFLAGVIGQVAALPALMLLCVGLALTVLGALLIPFAVVAYIIAVAGLVTLGFLAVARLSGIPAVRSVDLTPRGVNLRGLFIGLAGYLGIWLVAAAFTWHPVAGGVLRTIAVLITWVAATAGLGATLLSRAGTRRSKRKSASAADEYSWQTPTPVSGVAASRRR